MRDQLVGPQDGLVREPAEPDRGHHPVADLPALDLGADLGDLAGDLGARDEGQRRDGSGSGPARTGRRRSSPRRPSTCTRTRSGPRGAGARSSNTSVSGSPRALHTTAYMAPTLLRGPCRWIHRTGRPDPLAGAPDDWPRATARLLPSAPTAVPHVPAVHPARRPCPGGSDAQPQGLLQAPRRRCPDAGAGDPVPAVADDPLLPAAPGEGDGQAARHRPHGRRAARQPRGRHPHGRRRRRPAPAW